ncbi:discoidin domain-containing protein [Paenibacillus sp. BC26]|uniref:discoidin domain-containing protein n=1 Tax=Paenibacillus sp. BC26 TaxID=1881032 RepID=UPI0008F25FA7|nr:discoidin domain-containing protein [Paenibacillus sp. BC26]SFS67500.1 F5/8 type C domain-containing protein [Paenibacillus sp. BC26]
MKNRVMMYTRIVLAFLMAMTALAAFIPIGHARGEGTMLKTGNYVYSVSPDGGNSPDLLSTGLMAAAKGVLYDGTTAYAGWMGKAKSPMTVHVVIDLLRDYPLDQLRVVMNSPNKYWGFKDMTVKYRPEAATGYYIATRHIRQGSELNYTVNVPIAGVTARFIVLDITRTQAFQHIPLTEVEIMQGSGTPGQNPKPSFTAEQLKAELNKDALLVDRYGQWMIDAWPGKITSDAQLRQNYTDEAAALANVAYDQAIYDSYGGIKRIGKYESTGYFRLEQVNGKWWFITPDGYPFLLKGVDAASLWEAGYKTPTQKPDGTPRQIFEQLPDRMLYAPAYTKDENGEYVSFIVSNVMKKYGSDYEAKWGDITRKRLIQWGFNAFSKWTKPKGVTFPYVQVLQDPANLRRILWSYDMFDPQTAPIIESTLKTQLQNARTSKWLIGYTYDNEAGWTTDIVKELLMYGADSPAKGAFIDYYATRHGSLDNINMLLGMNAVSFNALKDTPIAITKVSPADVSGFITLASETYYAMIRDILKRNDPNHLFLGSTIVPTWRTSLDWDRGAMPYVDAFSVDSYTRDGSWMDEYEAFGKPLLNLEHSFGSSDRGLSYISAPTKTTSTVERGVAYRGFAESQAQNPLFVGSGWYAYFDQAVTGRVDGESYNIGLVNQQDQPYTDMVSIMKMAHAGLENIHLYGINLADGAAVAASSTHVATLAPANAVDGDGATRWGSNYTDDEWIYADLGAVKTVNRVYLSWEAAYAKAYKIQVSNDAKTWTDVFATTSGDGGIDDISFSAKSARYVRMLGLKRGSAYGYSLWRFEVFAPTSG